MKNIAFFRCIGDAKIIFNELLNLKIYLFEGLINRNCTLVKTYIGVYIK